MTPPLRERTGAHRPGSRPGTVARPVALVVAAAALAGGWALASGGLRSGAGSAGPSVASPAGSAGTLTTAATSRGTADSTASTARSTADATTKAGPSSSGTVDRTATVRVLNATRRTGLASRAAATLRTAGWAVDGLGNSRQPPRSTTVYYAGSRLRATAVAVTHDLPGAQRVERSTRFGAGQVTVVLGADYADHAG